MQGTRNHDIWFFIFWLIIGPKFNVFLPSMIWRFSLLLFICFLAYFIMLVRFFFPTCVLQMRCFVNNNRNHDNWLSIFWFVVSLSKFLVSSFLILSCFLLWLLVVCMLLVCFLLCLCCSLGAVWREQKSLSFNFVEKNLNWWSINAQFLIVFTSSLSCFFLSICFLIFRSLTPLICGVWSNGSNLVCFSLMHSFARLSRPFPYVVCLRCFCA